jgi:hypothetical protein
MARDRIFPTTEIDMASDKDLKTIDWDSVLVKLAETKEPAKGKFPEGLEDILTPKNELGEDDQEKDMACKCETEDAPVTAGKCPEHLKKFQFKGKDVEKVEDKDEDESEEEEEKEEEETPEEEKEEKEASVRMKKVHFAEASQIGHEAVEAAKASGDEALYNAILAARQDRRVRLANKVIEKENVRQAQSELEVKLAQRHAYRQAIASSVTEGESKIKMVVSKKNTGDGFKKVADMSKGQKTAFAKKALSLGYPQEYIDTILGVNEPKTAAIETEIREVMAANIPLNTKKTALTGLVKTAELDSAQKQRLVDYWIKDLGYGDEEWVKNWINKTYK